MAKRSDPKTKAPSYFPPPEFDDEDESPPAVTPPSAGKPHRRQGKPAGRTDQQADRPPPSAQKPPPPVAPPSPPPKPERRKEVQGQGRKEPEAARRKEQQRQGQTPKESRVERREEQAPPAQSRKEQETQGQARKESRVERREEQPPPAQGRKESQPERRKEQEPQGQARKESQPDRRKEQEPQQQARKESRGERRAEQSPPVQGRKESQPERRKERESQGQARKESRGDREQQTPPTQGRKEPQAERRKEQEPRTQSRPERADQVEKADRPPRAERPPQATTPEREARPPKPERAERPAKPAKAVSTRQTFQGKYAELALSDAMFAALAAAEYFDPTPVQAGLIPRALTGVDVMAQARTGTGKTASFIIPIFERLDTTEDAPSPQAIVLVPTRELAVQVRDEFVKLSLGRNVEVAALYGGKPIRKQTEQLRRHVDVVVGTPGRILDHMSRGTLDLSGIRIAVLDEADRMLDIGFRPDIEKILRRCPRTRQTLLLSATIPPPVERLARQYMNEPESLNFSPTDVAVETIEQFYFTVDPEQKFELLVKLIERENPRQAIVFCRTRRGTEKIYEKLSRHVEGAATIHGDLQQRTRDRVMDAFRKGKVRILVATDVVGRGIDVTSISHIINYDIPQFADDYVHRVGRTGRMGREGVAYTFVTPGEGHELTRIEMRINILLKRDEIAGVPTFAKPEAVETPDEPPPPKPSPKPVFGRPLRRVRRAL